MTLEDPRAQHSTTSTVQRPKKRKSTESRSRVTRRSSPSTSAAPQSASPTIGTQYYPAPLTASNLALAGALNAPTVGNRSLTTAAPRVGNANDCSSDVTNTTYSDPPRSALTPHTPLSAHAPAPAHPRLIIRIPSLAARRALAQARPNPPPPAAARATPVPKKRARSPTPDSDEDDFAASFMRKRHVSAAMFCTS